MKVRSGFVSNSSSSSYIVEIPVGFKIEKDKISEKAKSEIERWCDVSDLDKIVKVSNEALDIFHTNKYIHRGYDIDRRIFWGLVEILRDNKFVVMSVDGSGGDGEDNIIAFEDERLL
ncbi:MAG: hypothetical protein ACXAC5_05240 [Promethearchaeota archaeon]|jgi:hypothetical protein